MKIGNREFDTENNCCIMGILNVTPDSFSDGGKWNDIDRARAHAEEMLRDGADIIDVGGESTKPGYTKISVDEEIERVVPYIKMLKKEFDAPVSVDSYKPEVIEVAVKAGADLVNDIWGLKYDARVAELIAKYDVPCCLMHNRDNTDYTSFLDDVYSDLQETVDIAKKAGIRDDRIILDVGVGFAKNYEQNLAVINNHERFMKLGYPLLLGASRKSVIGNTLDLPADDRLEGTLAITAVGVMKGAAFIRVHDVKENARVVRMTRAILNERKV